MAATTHDVREAAERNDRDSDGAGGVPGAQDGSRDDVDRLFEGYRPYLLLLAQEVLGPRLRAKVGASDMVQETFLEAQRHREGFRGTTPVELRAWLRKILECRLANIRRHYLGTEKRAVGREVHLNGVRTPNGQVPQGLASSSPSPSTHAARAESMSALDEALERLPAHYRQTIVLRHQEQLSFREIGARMGCTEEAARKLWGRAIIQMRKMLGVSE